MIIKVTLEDTHYNRLPFYFESIEQIGELLFLALQEGYTASIEKAVEEQPEEKPDSAPVAEAV